MVRDNHEWMQLDNAALIYPVARRRNWMAMFRVSAELAEDIDPSFLQLALERTIKRFPSFAQRLRHGAFWYYLEHIDAIPRIQEDVANPCVRMDLKKNFGYMFRVRYYKKRIALEVFHVLTDGTGGLVFLKTLVAEYLKFKYGAQIPRGNGILDCDEDATLEELEDSFLANAHNECINRHEQASYRIYGSGSPDFMFVTAGIVSTDALLSKAKEYNCTVTEFLTAVLILAVAKMQRRKEGGRLKPVKVNVPVNLRKFYDSKTLRNFSSYVNPGIEPRFGEYSLEETIKAVKYYMGLEITEKRMNARFAANVKSQQNAALRVAPMVLKKYVMKSVYLVVGDRYSSTSMSNLGQVRLPEAMAAYVQRMDFMLGSLHSNPVTCACLSYNGKTCINFTRTIVEPETERNFFTALVKMGIHVLVESNGGID
ncbi:MAG TPA: alcohol acetyltransferase [Eubacteriales bacterium]|nr:alcohol acetyltransferase [Eubacteriales bacterium]